MVIATSEVVMDGHPRKFIRTDLWGYDGAPPCGDLYDIAILSFTEAVFGRPIMVMTFNI